MPKTVAEISIVSRDAWSAKPFTSNYLTHVPVRITIHHSGVHAHFVGDAKKVLRGIQRYHQRDKKWVDIAYHFFIDASGTIYEGSPADKVGDTATEYDPTGHISICLPGNYSIDTVTAKQRSALVHFLCYLCEHYSISPDSIKGHQDYAKTQCPGKNLYQLLDSIRHELKRILNIK